MLQPIRIEAQHLGDEVDEGTDRMTRAHDQEPQGDRAINVSPAGVSGGESERRDTQTKLEGNRRDCGRVPLVGPRDRP